MNLLERTAVHAESFSIDGIAPIYARRGCGPHAAGDWRVPQRSRCLFRRLLTGMYVLHRIQPCSELIWPVRAPERIAVINLRDERLCFRMRNLVFFEEGLRLSTIVNTQVPWLSFESPLITCLSGSGRVGIRIDGQADCVDGVTTNPPPHINLLRLAAWSADTRFGIAVEPGYSNMVLVAPASALVRSSSLVIAGRSDDEAVGTSGLLQRIARLITP
jgi:hypothetical protein